MNTQICRSPVVRKATQSGIYELDLEAPTGLRRTLTALQEQLRDLTALTPPTADLGSIRTRGEERTAAIGQAERALEEAERVLADDADSLPAVGAVPQDQPDH